MPSLQVATYGADCNNLLSAWTEMQGSAFQYSKMDADCCNIAQKTMPNASYWQVDCAKVGYGSNAAMRVSGVSWTGWGLAGEISSYLFDLPYLNTLSLSSNQLSGRIPDLWMQVPNITTVTLDNNRLVGGIPETLASSKNLQTLVLETNQLSGFVSYALQNSNIHTCTLASSLPQYGDNQFCVSATYSKNGSVCGSLPICIVNDCLNLNLAIKEMDTAGTIKAINSTDCCGEGSVTCSDAFNPDNDPAHYPKRVTAFTISSQGISGKISTKLGNVIGLMSLDLSGNFLHGNIPDTWIQLGHLTSINLSGNNLNGTIPSSLASLPSLAHFNFKSNSLGGTFPIEMEKRSDIQEILLDTDRFCGGKSFDGGTYPNMPTLKPCPTDCVTAGTVWVSMGGEPALKPNSYGTYCCDSDYIDCDITNHVSRLDFSSSSLVGNIADFSGFPNLKTLDLSNNSLAAGSIYTYLRNASYVQNLVSLDLSYNVIRGNLLGFAVSLPQLENLNLRNTLLSGNISLFFNGASRFSNVKYLDFSENSLTGNFPYIAATRFPSIRSLLIATNLLTGSLPDTIGTNLPGLVSLDISDNAFSGSLPTSISTIKSLQNLNAYKNQFVGVIPPMLNVQLLDLTSNLLIGAFPSAFKLVQGTKCLVDLTICGGPGYSSKTCGTLDTCKTECQSIGIIYHLLTGQSLTDDNIVGTNCCILTGIKCVSGSITELDWSDLSLTGTISPAIGSLTSLQALDLSNNNITGTIPATIGSLVFLQKLFLNGNNLTGSIPDAFASTRSLQFLNLANNSLQGSIPSSIATSRIYSCYIDPWICTTNQNKQCGDQPLCPLDCSTLRAAWTDIGGSKFITPSSYGSSCCSFTGVTCDSNQNIIAIAFPSMALSGTVSPSFGSLISLQSLDLSNNLLRGDIPEMFQAMKSLTSLLLNSNYLTGPIPESLSSAPLIKLYININERNLTSNQIAGTFPHGLESANFKSCGIDHSVCVSTTYNLTSCGILPSCSSDCSKLAAAWTAMQGAAANAPNQSGASCCNKNGVVCNAYNAITSITFSNSKLSSVISPILGQLTSLKKLYVWVHVRDLSANTLTGPIPLFLQSSSIISELRLDSNQLSGDFPGWLANLTSLTVLKLDTNLLTGVFPGTLNNLALCSISGNVGLCAKNTYDPSTCGSISVCIPSTTTTTASIATTVTSSQLAPSATIGIAISMTAIFVLIASILGVYIYRRYKKGRTSITMTGFKLRTTNSQSNLIRRELTVVHSL